MVKSAFFLSLITFFLFLSYTEGPQQAFAEENECKVCHGPVGPHINGYPGCDACHGYPPVSSAGLVFDPLPTGATTAGAHAIHASQTGSNYTCETCHFGAMPTTPIVDNNKIQIGFNAFGYGGGTYDGYTLLPPYAFEGTNGTILSNGGSKTCSGIYCHSDGTSLATGVIRMGTPPAWNEQGPLACSRCHGYPPLYLQDQPKANSHYIHQIFGCNVCHYVTTHDGSSINDFTRHANANSVYESVPDPNYSYLGTPVSFVYVFDPSGGTCSNVTCHGPLPNSRIWGGVELTAGIGWVQGDACAEVQFSGYLNGTPPQTFSWNFGDGQTGEGENITHFYAQPGTYTAELSATDSKRRKATTSQPGVIARRVNALPAPFAAVAVAGYTVTIMDYSTDPDYNLCGHSGPGTIVVQWGAAGIPDSVVSADFTNIPPAVGRAISRTYTTPGSYVIRHGVKDNDPSTYVYSGLIPVTVPSTYSVSGRVVRLDGTTPVSGVSMRLMIGTTVKKISSSKTDGTYTFTEVNPDYYTVRAVKSGLVFVDQPADARLGSVTNVNFTADR